MNKNLFRGTMLAAVAVPALIFAGVGTASAATTASAIGGRDHIRVTVVADGTGAKNCQIFIDGASKSQFNLSPNQTWSQVYTTGPGNRMVGVDCNSTLIFNTTVNVQPANTVLDFIDAVLGNVGSSQLSSDPALR